ncbi:hypothetical protein [Pseudomonas typographi]|uniref:Uncharacterized protein n=1 Tax=Pseudomonas typographi TaxID=2715964 RepID=A0ABR7Z761_9PSED|nr:hypothetical protein [Pseudomonas typographi]MBD1553996.1 hypothetical protein [Pseudomonas typographi]MBD1589259.1 hypothetical protein [Pseudomonas typographi]MBD1601287.1 hypothetical protein [Pseudomonas typographi]
MAEHGQGQGHSGTEGKVAADAQRTLVLENNARIEVEVYQIGASDYKVVMRVYDANGAKVHEESKPRKNDPGPASQVLLFGIDEAKRHAGGHVGVPLDNHNQKTPI